MPPDDSRGGLVASLPPCAHESPRSASRLPSALCSRHSRNRWTAAPLVTPFSAAQAGNRAAPGWAPIKHQRSERSPTVYDFVDNGGTIGPARHGRRRGEPRRLQDDVRSQRRAAHQLALEDQPADRHRRQQRRDEGGLAGAHRAASSTGTSRSCRSSDRARSPRPRSLSGRELPYATLMYIWSNDAPVGTVVAESRAAHGYRWSSHRAAQQASARGRRWRATSVDDYKHAFNEEPGTLTGVAVLTDTDNTGERSKRGTATSASCRSPLAK